MKKVDCEYFLDEGLCKAIIKGKEGKKAREESCLNESKNSCCYLCAEQRVCGISCFYLGKPTDLSENEENINREIWNCKKTIERLSVLFAEGKIHEQTYLKSVETLEKKIDKLNKIKESPLTRSESPYDSEELENAFLEKPTTLWYLVPFLFGVLGGIVAFTRTKDRDEGMIFNLLVFGIVWNVIAAILFLVILSSL